MVYAFKCETHEFYRVKPISIDNADQLEEPTLRFQCDYACSRLLMHASVDVGLTLHGRIGNDVIAHSDRPICFCASLTAMPQRCANQFLANHATASPYLPHCPPFTATLSALSAAARSPLAHRTAILRLPQHTSHRLPLRSPKEGFFYLDHPERLPKDMELLARQEAIDEGWPDPDKVDRPRAEALREYLAHHPEEYPPIVQPLPPSWRQWHKVQGFDSPDEPQVLATPTPDMLPTLQHTLARDGVVDKPRWDAAQKAREVAEAERARRAADIAHFTGAPALRCFGCDA